MEDLFNFQFGEFGIPEEPETSQPIEYCEDFMQDGKRHFRCTVPNCGKIFRFKSEVMRHRVIHFNSRPFDCPHEGCKKSFKRADALDNHLRIHTKEMPFECGLPGCGQKFTTKAGLRYHFLKHNDEKTYSCSFPGCDKSFLTLAQLKQHEKASNYHQKISVFRMPEEPVKTTKCYSKTDDQFYNDFFAPTPRPAKVVAWEMKNQEDEAANANNNMENFESMVKYILNENKMLKKKLDMCNQLMDAFQENNDLKSQLNKKLEPKIVEPQQPYFDDMEVNLFDFLKDKETTYF
jgi:hypothetical protein